MEQRAFPVSEPVEAAPAPAKRVLPSVAPRLDAPYADPFGDQAKRRAQKQAEREARHGRPERLTQAAPAFALDHYAQRKTSAAKARKPAPAKKPAKGTRVLRNGAALKLVSSRPVTASATTSAPAAETPKKKRFDTAAFWEGRRSGGGGAGGSGGGRGLNQDDITAVLIGIGLLLLLGWVWIRGMVTGGSDDDKVATPQLAANTEPAAKPQADPFGPGPVDLRPTSAPPAVAVAPAAAPILDVAPPPPPAPVAAAAPVAAPATLKPLNAYFCTARSTMSQEALTAFERDIAGWKTVANGREIVVTGFADTRGPAEYNRNLGALRADYVAELLRAHGFTVAEASSMGELPDLEDGQNCQNQRRVDIAFRGAGQPPSRLCTPPQPVMAGCD